MRCPCLPAKAASPVQPATRGGQFPELTPYGRYFKLTGYTEGQRTVPLSAMVVADLSATRQNHDSTGAQISDLNDRAILDFASLFAGGRITDNLGAFAQFTDTIHDHTSSSSGHWVSQYASDNTDLRYADHVVGAQTDWIWGLSLNNNPGVQDVWNSSPAWGYPYVGATAVPTGAPAVGTILEGGLAQQVVGLGGYLLVDRQWYVELSDYMPPNGALQALSLGKHTGDANNPRLMVQGLNPYVRLSYNPSWGAQNLMLGVTSFDARVHGLDGNAEPIYGQAATHYRDLGLDAQYQFLLDPHALTAQLRWLHERIEDPNNFAIADSTHAQLNTILAKVGYSWDARVGGSLAYYSVWGSSDSSYNNTNSQFGNNAGLVQISANNSPKTRSWTPELYCMPMPNLRLGLQYSYYTEYLGARRNYDGLGRNASDNNTTYLYLWLAY